MAKLELLNAKGTSDFPPEQKILRNEIESILTKIFETYGFSPLETPVLERYDILASKYAGGAEILKETFKLKDQGGRELALRYDLTVPLSRFVGMHPTLKLPFKRYQVGTVYRDGPVGSDRLRIFTQCDVDTIGAKSMAADAECVTLAEAVFKKLQIEVIIAVNSRKFLDGLLEDLKVPKEKWIPVILIIDKMKKVEEKKLYEELENEGLSKEQVKMLFFLLKQTKGTNKEKIAFFQKKLKGTLVQEGLKELEELFSSIPNADKKHIVFDPLLARGLAYYTGSVFEVVPQNEEITSSIAGGGRYDKMIGQFLGSTQEYPAVGISFGLDRLFIILEKRKKQMKKTVTRLFVIPINTKNETLKIVAELREKGVKVETDLLERGPSKNLAYANALGIPYVLFVGEDEVKSKKYKLKDMTTGKEEMLSLIELVTRLSDL